MREKKGKYGDEPLLLPIDIDPEPIEEKLTAWGGAALLVQAIRSLDVPGSARRNLHLKQRKRGYDEGAYVESFVMLQALGGDCVDDFERLREDPGIAELLGYEAPSPEAARKFLNHFHDEALMERARVRAGEAGQASLLPDENTALQGLGQVNRDLIAIMGDRCPEQKIATVDLDSTIIESWKRQAQKTYEGTTGYQPTLAVWAEMNLIVADEFRDGNVPAVREPLRAARQAFQALPASVHQYWFRGDSACYEQELLTWLRDETREGGPAGRIGFAVSAPMNRELQQEIAETAGEQWKLYSEDPTAVKEYAVIQHYPEELPENRYREPLRYIGIRIRRKQGELFEGGREVLHFAVATNLWDWDPKRLLEWHREKAGTIEAVHDVLKNELGAGVLPSKRFGADAAWLRLAVITHNVLSGLKRLALPAELLQARPKRLRFLIFTTPGRLIEHARRTRLKLMRSWARFTNWLPAIRALPAPALS
ncbi:MAG TPA: IS1380 family transposase [Bryobacteraceae bacterium]|nr:IS1380 family transposase [Bryobacteraceae bacterium]